MRRLIVLMAGVAAGVAAAVLVGARGQLSRATEHHEGMPDVTADNATPDRVDDASGDPEDDRHD